MKLQIARIGSFAAFVLFSFAVPATVWSQTSRQTIKQPREVIEAYRVCNRYYQVFLETLDFDRAFEATFTKNASRQREIAIADGEFGDIDLTGVDTSSLVSAYKSRMLILYLLLPLLSAETQQERAAFFPTAIQEVFDRKAPKTAETFNSYVAQLKQDVTTLRAHLEHLAKDHPKITVSMQGNTGWEKITVPTNYVVKPLTSYSRRRVLEVNEPYYRIENCTVISENGEMRLVGIKVFDLRF